MPVLEPNIHAILLRDRLQHPHVGLVACFCAAWCNTCNDYRLKFDRLSDQFPQYVFVWIDIENHPELLGDEDIENFPTLLIQQADRNVFYGPLQPHIGHLKRLLISSHTDSPSVSTHLPNVRQRLIGLV